MWSWHKVRSSLLRVNQSGAEIVWTKSSKERPPRKSSPREEDSIHEKELEEKMGVKLFVGRLPYEISEEELSKAFSEHGKIDSINIAKDRESGKSKGFAFVTFPSKEEAKAAIKAMNGSEIKGRKIVVEESSSGGLQQG